MKPNEEVKRELVKQWIFRADEDLKAAKVLLSQEGVAFSFVIGFHAQQAVEKYLKAFLTWRQAEFPKTHDIGDLLDLIERIDRELSESLREAVMLTDYAVNTRYPGDLNEISEDESAKAIVLAEMVRAEIAQRLSPDYLA